MPNAPPMDVKSLVAEVVRAVERGSTEAGPACISWKGEHEVRITPSLAVPDEDVAKQTTSDRRKRFKNRLIILMKEREWQHTGDGRILKFTK